MSPIINERWICVVDVYVYECGRQVFMIDAKRKITGNIPKKTDRMQIIIITLILIRTLLVLLLLITKE